MFLEWNGFNRSYDAIMTNFTFKLVDFRSTYQCIRSTLVSGSVKVHLPVYFLTHLWVYHKYTGKWLSQGPLTSVQKSSLLSGSVKVHLRVYQKGTPKWTFFNQSFWFFDEFTEETTLFLVKNFGPLTSVSEVNS